MLSDTLNSDSSIENDDHNNHHNDDDSSVCVEAWWPSPRPIMPPSSGTSTVVGGIPVCHTINHTSKYMY